MSKANNTGLETILSGARLLAAAHNIDADTLEGIVRKAAHVGNQARNQSARRATAND